MVAVAQHCPCLKDVNLDGCALLSDATVVSFAQHCPQLTHFLVRNYRVLKPVIQGTSSTLSDFPAGREQVEYQEVYPETTIRDASIAALAAHSVGCAGPRTHL